MRCFLIVLSLGLCLTATAGAETPDEVYSFANHLKKDGLFEAAAQQYLKFARENPTDPRSPDALFNAADCLAETDNTTQAITVLETIASTYPDHPEQCRYQMRLGRLYYKAEEYEKADQVFTRVVVTMPDCSKVPDAMLGKAEAMISLKNFAGAAEVLRNLVDTYIESEAAPRGSYNLAFCLRKIGREDEALQTYERIVVQFPGNPIAGFSALEAARMQAERDNVDRAIDFYARARDFGTKVFAVPAGQEGGDLLRATGRNAEALRWYEQLLARPDLDDPRRVYIQAVGAAYDAGEYDAVARLAASYEEQFPGTFSPQIEYTGALAALQQSEYDDALEAAARLERFAPGTEWARSTPRIRGRARLGKGHPREAIDEYQQFVAVSGDSTATCEVLREIADISFTVTRDTVTALGALERLLDVERRRFPGDMLDVARTNEQVYRYRAARAVYDDIITRFPLSDEAEMAAKRAAYLDEFTVTDQGEAAARMDRVAYEIATGARDQALLQLLDARINVTRNLEGALSLCRSLRKSEKDKPTFAGVVYYEGLAYAKLARRDLDAVNPREKSARDHAKKAYKAWDELVKKYPQSEQAAAASYERLLLRARVEGDVDIRTADAVLAAYPGRSEGKRLLVMLGDQFAARSSGDDLARGISYYDRALQIDPDDASVRLARATTLARQGKQKEALAAFEALAAAGQTRVALKAAYEAGRSLRALRSYRDAIPYFDRVAAADPSGSFGAAAAMQAGDCVYLQKNYEGAMARYEAAERAATNPQRAWDLSHRIALCLKNTGRYADSLTRLTDCLLSEYGGDQRERVFQDAAEVAELMGDVDARITILEAYVEEIQGTEGSNAASRQLVRLYLVRGQADDAYELASRIARAAPKEDAEARALVAMALYRQGKSSDAKKVRDQVAALAGEDSDIVREIGIEAARYQYDQKQFKAAVESIRPFAESCSGEGVCEDARYLYAMSLLAANEVDRGNVVAQSFFRDYPLSQRSPELHLRMGNVLAASNRTSESLLHYEEAAETASDSTVTHMAMANLGVSLQGLKRWREAEQVWQRMLQRFPDGQYAAEASLNVARCKMERGDYRGAIAAYEEAMPLLDTESRARAFYWMGTSYEQLGEFQSAVVEYLKVPYLASGGGMWVVTAQLKAADCYVRIGRKDAAREIYGKVIRAHGATSNWGGMAQKKLDELNAAGQTSGDGGRR